MYSNVGEDLKGLATVCSWIVIICSVVLGLFLLFSDVVILAIVVASLGSLLGWCSGLALYGFGELICETQKNGQRLDALIALQNVHSKETENNKSISNNNETMHEAPIGVPPATTRRRQHVQSSTNQLDEDSQRKVVVDRTVSKTLCPYCGTVQKSDRNLCFTCGALFIDKN